MSIEATDRTALVLSMVLLSIFFLAGTWDLFVLFTGKDGRATVSYYLSMWARQFPVATFAMGVLMGHLLWQIPGVPTKMEIKP